MRWMISEEAVFAIAAWQVVLGGSLAILLALLLRRLRGIQPASRYHVCATAFFTVALLPWIALWPTAKETTPATTHTLVQASNGVIPPNHDIEVIARTELPLLALQNQPEAYSQQKPEKASQGQTPTMTQASHTSTLMPFTLEEAGQQLNASSFSWREEGVMLLLGFWAAVAFFLLIKLLLGIKHLHLLKREAQLMRGPLANWFKTTLDDLKMWRSPVLKTHESIASPLVAGLFRPTILIPQPLTSQLSGEELRQILLHELAHIRRNDDWVHFFQKAVLALFWFHPALHWFSRQMAWDRESACDQWAVAQTGKSKQYAYSLLRVSETMVQPNPGLLTVGAVRGKKQLSHRIEVLLNTNPRINRLNGAIKILVSLLLVACVASMAIAGPKLVWFQTPETQATQREEAEKETEKEVKRREVETLRREKAHLEESLRRLQQEYAGKNDQTSSLDAAARENDLAKQELLELQKRINEENQRLQSDSTEFSVDYNLQLQKLEQQRMLVHQALELSRARENENQNLLHRNQERVQALLEEAQASGELHGKSRQEFRALKEKLQAEMLVLEKHRSLAKTHEGLAFGLQEKEYEAMAHAHNDELTAFHRVSSYRKVNHRYVMGDVNGRFNMEFNNDSFEISIRGQVTFSADETAVEAISKGGSFQLVDKRERGNTHSLKIKPGPNNTLSYAYRFNRSKRDFASSAQQWFTSALPQILQESGIGAEERVARILEEKGVAGVLDLVSSIQNSYGKNQYIQSLVASTDLMPDELTQIMAEIKRIDSDFYRSHILVALAKKRAQDPQLASTLVDAMQGMSSDFEKRRVLTAIIPIAEDAEAMMALLELTKTIRSDFEKRQVLVLAGEQWPAGELIDLGYLAVLGQIRSDFEFRQVVETIATEGSLSQAQAGELANLAATKVRSDFELGRILYQLSPILSLNSDFEKAFSQFNSDHEKTQLLNSLMARNDLEISEQEIILNCARTISSEFNLTRVLQTFRNRFNLEGELAKTYQSLVNGIRSPFHRNQLTDH